MIAGVIFWLALCVAVGYVAKERGRDPFLWGVVSAVISPLIGFIVLLAVGKK